MSEKSRKYKYSAIIISNTLMVLYVPRKKNLSEIFGILMILETKLIRSKCGQNICLHYIIFALIRQMNLIMTS